MKYNKNNRKQRWWAKGKIAGKKKFERKQWTIDDVRWRFILTMNAIYAILKVFDYSYISRQIIDQKKKHRSNFEQVAKRCITCVNFLG